MPTWSYTGPWMWHVAWNLIAFMSAFVLNSFIEHLTHLLIMHRRCPLIPYGYDHTTSHHAVFGSGETYHATQPWMLAHGIGFTWREYLLFPIFCSAVYIPVELVVGRPLYVGAIASVFVGLIAFDVLHRRFHNPRDTWFQRSRLFLFLKNHHRRHHEDMTRNLNVVFPLADLLFGTLLLNDPEKK